MAVTEPQSPDLGAAPFLPLSARISRRLRLGAWLEGIGATSLPVFVLLLLSLAAALLARGVPVPALLSILFPLTASLLLLWLLGLGTHVLRRPIEPSTALAVFDARSDNRERFLSAYCLALDSNRDAGASLHVRRTLTDVDAALDQVAGVLPLRLAPALRVLAPALLTVAVLALLGLEEQPHLAPKTPTPPTLLEEVDAAPPSAAPSPSPLRQRAAEATRLATEEGPTEEQVGPALLAALARHAETAPLAAALSERAHDQAANHAGRLARRLKTANLSTAARQRVESALSESLEAATVSDKKTQLGVALREAHGALTEDRNQQAAATLEQMARRLRRVDQNARAKKALDRLADDQRKTRAPQGEPHRLPGLTPDRLRGLNSRRHATLPGGRPGTRPGQPGTAGGPASEGETDANTPGQGTADGRRAGVGRAPYGQEPTTPLPSTHDEAVAARISQKGESKRLRRKPEDSRKPQPPAPAAPLRVVFSDVPEGALAADPLPLSKQELVWHYLKAIRARFHAATDRSTR